MGLESLAGLMGQMDTKWGEIGVQGVGTLLDGLNNIINPSDYVPPFIGMSSSDYMNVALASIMASQNTNLKAAQSGVTNLDLKSREADEMTALINDAISKRFECSMNHGHAARMRNAGLKAATQIDSKDVKDMQVCTRKIIGVMNTQAAQWRLYNSKIKNAVKNRAAGVTEAEALRAAISNDPILRFDFMGLLKNIIKGVGKVFGYVDKAKTIYEKAKPWLEKI